VEKALSKNVYSRPHFSPFFQSDSFWVTQNVYERFDIVVQKQRDQKLVAGSQKYVKLGLFCKLCKRGSFVVVLRVQKGGPSAEESEGARDRERGV
jgi:hypothetical protein